MRSGPSRMIEAAVGIFIPPSHREHVLGDLYERYSSTWQYILDAIFTVPLVIGSRIVRTTDFQVLAMEAAALYLSLMAAAWQAAGIAFFDQQAGCFRLMIPAAVGLAALVVGDIYGCPETRSAGHTIGNAAWGVTCALLAQAALPASSPGIVFPAWVLISSGVVSTLLVAALRLLFPPGSNRPRGEVL